MMQICREKQLIFHLQQATVAPLQQTLRTGVCALLAVLMLFVIAPLQAQNVVLSPGADVAARVAAAPPGTKFVFSPGIYVAQQINPKDGDSFTGEGKAILDGAEPISFTSSGNLWSAPVGLITIGKIRCMPDHPLCNIQRDLYLDNDILTPIADPTVLNAHTWFYDQTNGRAVINFNPAGHKLEISTVKFAFNNTGRNVTITHLIVEKYASPPQFGAIGGQGPLTNGQGGAQGWTVTDTEVRLSHGTGIQLSDHATIEKCNVHHNGQKGIGARGLDVLVENSEIAFNNYAGYDPGWEAGGTKFARTTNLRVLNNYVHDNVGSGLWTDIDNKNTTYRLNRVDNNAGSGIQHEISYDAVIENNTLRWNGVPPRISLWQAQISVQNSSNVIVRDNVVIVPPSAGNGIVVINQERGTGDLGTRLAVNNQIRHNTITFEGTGGASGLMDSLGTAANNIFDDNIYIFKVGGQHFEWHGKKSWEQYRALGNDPSSRIVDASGKPIKP
ncbi:right-handed parallel beta-helix repeat-containing protein [Tunturibacter psychrotolerans]|uniref:Right-handed parallel beta-helix repeat-containing protein n=1 Tax=Tunturiibacter psychrotolerans TaxID=3069686 RepID=A0AAU7ZKC1_9BACT